MPSDFDLRKRMVQRMDGARRQFLADLIGWAG
jgi:hypothetical protein